MEGGGSVGVSQAQIQQFCWFELPSQWMAELV